MGRPQGSKNKNRATVPLGSRFRNWEGERPKDIHIRLTLSMMNSLVYKGLSSSARTLYAYMKMSAAGSNEFEYAASLINDVMSKPTFLRSRDELVEKGFIKYTNKNRAKYLREVAKYEFSAAWIDRADNPI